MGGPRLVLLTAFVIGSISAALLGPQGVTEEPLRLLLRVTARTSLALFLLAFSAASLRRVWPHAVSRWMLKNRRYLGLSFAVSHAYHLLFIAALNLHYPVENPASLLYGGGFGYVMLALMAVTSNDASVQALGSSWWRRLHLLGGYTLWVIFASVYLPTATSARGFIASLGLVGAMSLRIYARRRGGGG